MVLTGWHFMLKINNTIGGMMDFIPMDKKNVRMYVCGPTVYNRIHPGNARNVVIFDVLFRLLRKIYGDECVKYARNITDIDDKIIKASIENNITETELTQKTIKYFHEDCEYLKCLQPTFEPKVSEEIPEIIKTIEKIITNGHAYVEDGNVMFSVESYAEYGQLSNRKIETNIQNERIAKSEYKHNQDDFLLWKKTEEGITWDSPWGKGRPGWHIECSAMSNKYLGENFDIHGGGADLKFPHHENEIAQSKCANVGSIFAKYWIHNGFLMVEGQKMSKSLGNFIMVDEIRKQGVNGNVLRLALLTTQYRKPMNFTNKLLQDSEKMLYKFSKCLDKIDKNELNGFVLSEEDISSLCQDLNTTKYIADINKAFNDKQYLLVIKMLDFIGIDL